MRTLGIVFLAATALAQAHHRTENRALLGIVAVPTQVDGQVEIAHVLEKSPAAKAGLQKGDSVVEIAGKSIRTPEDVDAALKEYAGKEKVEIGYRRDKTNGTATAKLIERAAYRGDFLKPQRHGATKFKAPEWFVYKWAQAGEQPPTLASSKKKVVVIHCFQSW